MPSIHPQYRGELQAAVLFMADKYRKVSDLARRFRDQSIIDAASPVEESCREIAIVAMDDTVILTPAQSALAQTAVGAFIDELNRGIQNAQMRGLLEQAEQLGHKLRSVYAARASLAGGAGDSTAASVAADAIGRAASGEA